jgi:Flp pilus assembly protein TadG
MPDQRPALDRPRPGRASLLRRFRRDRRGATAVEFSLVALPFFGMLFAIMETALVFWSGQVLEVAVADASRALYTGNFQNNPNNATDVANKFRTSICDKAGALIANCTSNVYVDVRVLPKFGSTSIPDPVKNGDIDPTAFGYMSPKAKEVVLVRAAVAVPIHTLKLNPGLSNLNGGKRLIMASAAFMTEPYAAN